MSDMGFTAAAAATDPFSAHFARRLKPQPQHDPVLRHMPREPIAQRLAEERQKPGWQPGHDVGMAAYQAGRISMLVELLRDIDAAQIPAQTKEETP